MHGKAPGVNAIHAPHLACKMFGIKLCMGNSNGPLNRPLEGIALSLIRMVDAGGQ